MSSAFVNGVLNAPCANLQLVIKSVADVGVGNREAAGAVAVEVPLEAIEKVRGERVTGEIETGAANIETAGVLAVSLRERFGFEGGVIGLVRGILVASLEKSADRQLEIIVGCLDEESVVVADGGAGGDLAAGFGVGEGVVNDSARFLRCVRW